MFAKLQINQIIVLSMLAMMLLFASSCSETTTNTGGTDGDSDVTENSENESDNDSEFNIVLDGDIEEELDYEIPEQPGEHSGYRFDSLKIVQPDSLEFQGMDIKEMADSQIAKSIESYQINLFLKPKTTDVLDFPYEMDFLFGERVDEKFVISEDSIYALDIIKGTKPTEFITDENTEIKIPLGSQDMDDLIIKDAVISGIYEGSAIINGFIAGAISKEDAEKMEVYKGTTLAMALGLLGMTTDYTFGDGTKGYTLILTFTCEMTDIEIKQAE